YDGLTHAGFFEAGVDIWGESSFGITDLADGRWDRVQAHEVTPGHPIDGHPLREIDDLLRDRAHVIQLHGSLGWLWEPSRDGVWKFRLNELRMADYWECWREGGTEWSPAVVLTDRKDRATATWPFSLAYDVFHRRLADAERWLIAGY